MSQTHPEYVITLVNGTFAADAPWVRRGSPLRTALTKALEGRAVFRIFRWSPCRYSGNTHKARLTAGEALALRLRVGFKRFPRAKHFVIAHSHGGNVTLYAQDPTPLGANPYPQLFGGARPQDLLRLFPWNRLQVVRMQLRRQGADGRPLAACTLACF